MSESTNDSDERPDDPEQPSAQPDGSSPLVPSEAPGLEPESAFDALPDPSPETDAGSYGDWPYTDQRPAYAPPSPERPIDARGETTGDIETDEDVGRGDMGFFDHLEELRSRIIKALLGLIGGAIIAAFYSEFIIGEILLLPAKKAGVPLINIVVMGQLTLTLQVVLLSGLIISIPWIIWQFWQFVKPGLYPKERKYSSWVAVATIFCFLSGVAFAYFVMIPTSLDFAQGFVYGGIVNQWAVTEYFSFVLGFILACGVVFEMPMLAFALGRFGILTPAFMRHYRRHAAVGILIVSAIITPTPDPFNQLILAVPLYALFEISILVSTIAVRKRDEAYAEMFNDDDIENTAGKQ